jgi:hypothetical protein
MQHDMTLRENPWLSPGSEQSRDHPRSSSSRVLGNRLEPRQPRSLLKEDLVNDDRNVWTSVTLMALVGGAIAAFLYTDRGRQSLMRFEETLDDFGRSLQQLRGAVQKAGLVAAEGLDVATEGMEVVSNLIGKTERRPGSRSTH